LRTCLVQTKDVKRLFAALVALRDRNRALAGLGLLVGVTGTGKTTALGAAVAMFNAVYVVADSAVTMTSLLSEICTELGFEPPRSPAQKLKEIVSHLRERPRPIFVDEADRLTHDSRILEVLRDIHDLSGVPVMLIGMDRFERKLLRHPQFARRITQRIEFGSCDLDDTTRVTQELCEVEVAPDLIAKMHLRTKGNLGLMMNALDKFEAMARDNNWKVITAEQFGSQAMYLGDRGA